MINIDELAQEIRRVDGAHKLGAGALAECLMPFIEARTSSWQSMETAPTDGKHVILAMKRGPFVWAVQGSFMERKWMNAADIQGEPLCWLPNILIPDQFLPWTDEYKASADLSTKGEA